MSRNEPGEVPETLEPELLVELQSRLAYQEDELRQLSDIVARQSEELRALHVEMARLKELLRAVAPAQVAEGLDETPPHY